MRENIKIGFRQVGILLIAVLIVIGPWIIYNQINYGRDPLTWKIQEAIKNRFFKSNTRGFNEIDLGSKTVQVEIQPRYLESHSNQSISSLNAYDFNYPVNSFVFNNYNQNFNDQAQTENTDFYKSKTSIVVGHLLNNQIKSLFVLPFQIYPARLTYVLDQEYWQEPVTWNGDMPAEGIIAFVVNLIILSFGLAFAWRHFGWTGLIPLIIQVSYHLSNALVRTSGSRYLVAVDWVVYFYFLLGIWFLLQAVNLIPKVNPNIQKEQTGYKNQFWIVLVIGVVIGLLLPVLNITFPVRYTNETKEQVFERLPISRIEEETEFNLEHIQSYYESPNSFFLYGRELYPEHGENTEIPAGWAVTFTLLTPDQHQIILPYNREVTELIPAGEDFIVFGCKDPKNDMLIAHLGYFVQSDRFILSTSIELDETCE